MNKSELIVKVHEKINEHEKTSLEAVRKGVDAYFQTISQAMINNQDVKISGFGVFGVRAKRAMLGYNPQTGKRFFIGQGMKPHFRASKSLKAAMNVHKVR